MALHTASEGISFARELEERTAQFYRELATRFSDDAETFVSYADANDRFVANVQRAYYGVITDAIEGCYAFKGLEPEQYRLDVDLDPEIDRAAALAKALKNEETILGYYTEAAEQCKGTMADVPRAFSLVARKRGERIEQLKALAAQ